MSMYFPLGCLRAIIRDLPKEVVTTRIDYNCTYSSILACFATSAKHCCTVAQQSMEIGMVLNAGKSVCMVFPPPRDRSKFVSTFSPLLIKFLTSPGLHVLSHRTAIY